MQQTDKYKLNLIETDDTFSPAPLNENMDKVEAKFAALDGADAALDGRLAAIEAHKLVVGSYVGNAVDYGTTQTITLGFQPQAVYVYNARVGHAFATWGNPYHSGLVITENGFKVTLNDSCSMNLGGTRFLYVAYK